MHIIARGILRLFWIKHPDSEQALKSWFYETKHAQWQNSAEIKSQYRESKILNNERVVFKICGNKYRMIVRINYASKTVFIRFIGTHKEYDRIDAENI